MKRFLAAALLALCPAYSFAQVRVGAAAEAGAVPAVVPVVTGPSATSLPLTGLSLPSASISLSVAPAPTLAPTTINAVEAVPALAPTALATPVAEIGIRPLNAEKAVRPLNALSAGLVVKSRSQAAPLAPAQKADALVAEQVADWGERRADDATPVPFSAPSSLGAFRAAASAETPAGVPTPPAQTPNGSHPRLSKALVVIGAALIGASAVVILSPAWLPAALAVSPGALVWPGFAALAASRYWRAPEQAPDVPRGPPAPAGGTFSSFKAAWAAARDSADAQASFEKRVGGSSWTNFRDWLIGGLRTGLYWMAPSLLLMLGGAIVAKGGMLAWGVKAAAVSAAPAADAGIATIPISTLLMSYLPGALAFEAAGVALFFAVEWIAKKLGAGKAAPWLGGAAAMGLALGGLLMLTSAPFVIVVSLALEAGVIWTAARSRSFAAPLALRGILTLFSLEAARFAAWIKFGAAGALVGLPPVWGGVFVAALAIAAWKFKASGLKLKEIGDWWNAPANGQRPKSPSRIISAALVWSLVVYAVGDLSYWAINAVAPASEPAPALLAKMLGGGVDLILYNFIIVGMLEEYVFRRGLFKMMNEKLEKWGLTVKKAFWIAAIGSGLIFSGVHHIDWSSVMAWFGMGDATNASGLGGAYAFTWAGFVTRAFLGVVFAWIYKRSGLILIPILAHTFADSMEGLGMRWGFHAFLALAAGCLVASWLLGRTPKPKSS